MAGKSTRVKILEEITNYLEISTDLHTAGQPTVAQLGLLKAAGMDVVINLAPDISQNAIRNERELVEQSGMEYVYIPVVWQHPTTNDLEQFYATMRKTREQVKFVHCVLNMRVSAFTYLYRVSILKEPRESAWQNVLEIWQPEGVWADFIHTHLV
jgi:protein tyrosine phosphatase (PTP) superfamily phosphohydrolase (DUF442 family)